MTKQELIERIYENQPHLSQRDIKLACLIIIDQMGATLANDDRIEVRGFGSFCIHHHQPRKSRNPKTGEEIDLQAVSRVHFKPGKGLREMINAARKRERRNAVTKRLRP